MHSNIVQWNMLFSPNQFRIVIVQSFCDHFSDNLKVIATEGFSLQNVSLVSLEWHIKTWWMGNILFWGTKKGVVFRIFWCHFTFTANQVMVIEDTILVTKPTFRIFIVITPCQIHLRDINKKKWEKCSKCEIKFGVILTYLKGIFSDYKYLKLGLHTDLLVQSFSGYFLDNYKQNPTFFNGIYVAEVCSACK